MRQHYIIRKKNLILSIRSKKQSCTLWTKLKQLVQSKFFLIVSGFILTTIISNTIIWEIQRRQWKRDESIECLDELSLITSERLYKALRAYWGIEYLTDVNQRWKDYQVAVDNYNKNREKLYFKISKLVSNESANKLFNDYTDQQINKKNKSNTEKTTCLHKALLNVHNILLCYNQCKFSTNASDSRCMCPDKNNDQRYMFTFNNKKYSSSDVYKEIEDTYDVEYNYINMLNKEVYDDINSPWLSFISPAISYPKQFINGHIVR